MSEVVWNIRSERSLVIGRAVNFLVGILEA